MVQMMNNFPTHATKGERTFYNFINLIFKSNPQLICYYNPYLDEKHPDYLLLSPQFGVVIVEIKDYAVETLVEVNKSGDWKKRTNNGTEKFLRNPFQQIFEYRCKVGNKLDRLPFYGPSHDLITQLVILSQIPRDSPAGDEIAKMVPSQIHVCYKENFTRHKKFHVFLNQILPSDSQLTPEEFTKIRGNLVPTSRIPCPKQRSITSFLGEKDQIILLDQHQEKLARKLGEGHRLIFGVAGSGKTVMLLARARFLALRHPDWRILILCYNKYLARYLQNSLNPADFHASITIRNFHKWAREYIRNSSPEFEQKYLQAEREAKRTKDFETFFGTTVPALFLQVIEHFHNGGHTGQKTHLDSCQVYDAILIDEAQDFDAQWLKCVMQVLNPATNSLFVTCDGLQGIYAQKQFRWVEVGIHAVGRTKYLRKSYRTPIEIGQLAQKTIPTKLQELIQSMDEFLATEEFSGIHGTVELILGKNRTDEYQQVIHRIREYRSTKSHSILILFHKNWRKLQYKELFFDLLRSNHLDWLELEQFSEQMDQIFIGTLHGTKGLEADTVIIPKIDTFYSDSAKQLLYVGFTRAKHNLILSAARHTDLVQILDSEIHLSGI